MTAEHRMMAEQSRLSGDPEMLAEIIPSVIPQVAKLGRKVQNFEADIWSAKCVEMVVNPNIRGL